MKILYLKSMVVGLLSLTTIVTNAQQLDSRIKMYAALPNQINIETAILSTAISYTKGNVVNIDLSSDLKFTGTVIFKENSQANLQTIAIKSSEINDAILHINKITNADNTVSYTGRILNPNAADGYLLKNINGIYTLQKFESTTLLDPCKL